MQLVGFRPASWSHYSVGLRPTTCPCPHTLVQCTLYRSITITHNPMAAQAAPRPSPDYDSPIYQPYAPDHDFMQPPAPPPSAPRLTRFRYSQDQGSIRRFQENQSSQSDEQWHRLVPEEARASLPEREVNRQGLIFELIRSEKEYVADLEALLDVSSIPLVFTSL